MGGLKNCVLNLTLAFWARLKTSNRVHIVVINNLSLIKSFKSFIK